MKIFRSLLIALAMLSLIACGDDGGSLNGEDLVDSGVEDDAAVKPPPGEDDEDEEGDPKDDDPGDGDDDDPGDGDPGDGDPGDGDPGDGDDDDPGDDEPATLALRVVNEQLEAIVGATIRVKGVDSEPAISDENGEIAVEVPVSALYLVSIEPPGGGWAAASIFEAGGEGSASLIVMLPDAPLDQTYGEKLGFELSNDTGVVAFMFTDVTPHGQSVSLPEGQPYIQLAPEPPDDVGILAPGATLISGGGNTVLYAETPPGEISPVYSSPNAGESCRSIGEPYGGWLAMERNVVLVEVTCL